MLNHEDKTINQFINAKFPNDKKEELAKKIIGAKFPINNKENFDENLAWSKFKEKVNHNTTSKKKNIKQRTYISIAASIILLIGISVFTYLSTNNKNKFAEFNSMQEIKELVLPDGSIVTLNRNSSIKFPKKFASKNRLVEFTGEAFFKISKNKNKPFIIKSNNAKITVLGTSFNVNSKNKKNILVTVKTGKVKFEKKNKEHLILIAGETGEIKNSKILKKKNLNKNFLSWKTKQFEYYGEKLSKVISDFNDVYQVNITTSTTDINNLQITTTINGKDVYVALNIICQANNLKYTTNKNNILISKK